MPRYRLPDWDKAKLMSVREISEVSLRCVEFEGCLRKAPPDWWRRDGERLCICHQQRRELTAVLACYPRAAMSLDVRLHFEDLEAYMELADEWSPEWDRTIEG